jgi:hypothetical protein
MHLDRFTGEPAGDPDEPLPYMWTDTLLREMVRNPYATAGFSILCILALYGGLHITLGVLTYLLY